MIVHHAGSIMRLLRLDLMIGRANCQCLKQQTVPQENPAPYRQQGIIWKYVNLCEGARIGRLWLQRLSSLTEKYRSVRFQAVERFD